MAAALRRADLAAAEAAAADDSRRRVGALLALHRRRLEARLAEVQERAAPPPPPKAGRPEVAAAALDVAAAALAACEPQSAQEAFRQLGESAREAAAAVDAPGLSAVLRDKLREAQFELATAPSRLQEQEDLAAGRGRSNAVLRVDALLAERLEAHTAMWIEAERIRNQAAAVAARLGPLEGDEDEDDLLAVEEDLAAETAALRALVAATDQLQRDEAAEQARRQAVEATHREISGFDAKTGVRKQIIAVLTAANRSAMGAIAEQAAEAERVANVDVPAARRRVQEAAEAWLESAVRERRAVELLAPLAPAEPDLGRVRVDPPAALEAVAEAVGCPLPVSSSRLLSSCGPDDVESVSGSVEADGLIDFDVGRVDGIERAVRAGDERQREAAARLEAAASTTAITDRIAELATAVEHWETQPAQRVPYWARNAEGQTIGEVLRMQLA